MIVVLLGYMGSGKSSIGRALSLLTPMQFIDLDDYISSAEGMSVAAIFKKEGEIYFRKREHQLLKSLLNTKDNLILSLGGGTPCYSSNMDLLNSNKNVLSIYLKASIPVLADRLFDEREGRPLISHLKSKDELVEFIGKHIFERKDFYQKADIILDTSILNESEVLEKIIFQLF